MAQARHQTEQRGNRLFTVIVIAISAIGTTVAAIFSDRGAVWPAAAFAGAAVGVITVWMCAYAYASYWRMIWRRKRGYPFESGDSVEVTTGDATGERGFVKSHDQGIWHYEVQFDTGDGKPRSRWVAAGQLRKIGHK